MGALPRRVDLDVTMATSAAVSSAAAEVVGVVAACCEKRWGWKTRHHAGAFLGNAWRAAASSVAATSVGWWA